MKRTGHLFEAVLERDNLRLAFWKALKGKRTRPDAQAFAACLERELQELAQGVPVGRFHQFLIRDPKERVITAPGFDERVLHHAIMNVCEPVFERWLIDDTFACRVGKGRIAGLLRARQFSARQPLAVKLDMRKYFDSVSHQNLLARLERLFCDQRLLDLFSGIVASYATSPGRGLPIGSLTSQHLANFYLGWFDRFVSERLKVRGYLRYMDDCVLWSDSVDRAQALASACSEFLDGELELTVKPFDRIHRTRHGFEFLGCRVYPNHLKLAGRSRRRFRKKLAALETSFEVGDISERDLQERATSLLAFCCTTDLKSWKFRTGVLQQLAVSGHGARTG